jgi:hypothetical protein
MRADKKYDERNEEAHYNHPQNDPDQSNSTQVYGASSASSEKVRHVHSVLFVDVPCSFRNLIHAS